MKEKSITLLLPCVSTKPYGGCKISLDYCNALQEAGYEVHIVYPCSLLFKQRSFLNKLKSFARWFKYIGRYSCRKWYPLHKEIIEHFVPSLDYHWVPKTNLYIATSVETAIYLNQYGLEKKRNFYFIQDFETWNCDEATVRRTYHFPFTKIVISKWLESIICNEEGESCVVVPNGFDSSLFKITVPVEEKNKYEISMMDHVRPTKDVETGFKALCLVKETIENLRVNVYSIYPPSRNFPDWVHFYYNPSFEEHLAINNRSAIYLATSKAEGWGLTIGEAMLCGQAVVCTNNKGYLEMAKDGYNALVSDIGDYKGLSKRIIRLIEDDSLRYQISKNAENSIKQYDNKISEAKFIAVINGKLS